jgi:hypothetical protein
MGGFFCAAVKSRGAVHYMVRRRTDAKEAGCMIVTLSRTEFDTLIKEPYGVLATYLAYRFLQEQAGRAAVSQYAIYTMTPLSRTTVKRAWRRLTNLGMIHPKKLKGGSGNDHEAQGR